MFFSGIGTGNVEFSGCTALALADPRMEIHAVAMAGSFVSLPVKKNRE